MGKAVAGMVDVSAVDAMGSTADEFGWSRSLGTPQSWGLEKRISRGEDRRGHRSWSARGELTIWIKDGHDVSGWLVLVEPIA